MKGGRGGWSGGEGEEEYLGDVVVALEVTEVGVGAEDGEDEGGEGGLLEGELGFALIWERLVGDCSG